MDNLYTTFLAKIQESDRQAVLIKASAATVPGLDAAADALSGQAEPDSATNKAFRWMQAYAPTLTGALGGLALGNLFGGRKRTVMGHILPTLVGGGLGYLYQNLPGSNLSEKWTNLTQGKFS